MLFKNANVKALLICGVLSNIFRLGSNLLMARMVGPEVFAVVGLAATFLFAFEMMSDLGFKAFILRHPQGDSNNLLSTLWTTRFIRNLVLAFLLFSLSSSISNFFEMAHLSLVLKILSLAFIFDALTPLSDLIAERENKVYKVLYMQLACYLISTVITLFCLYFYRSYWPIVAGMLFNGFLVMISVCIFLGAKGTFFNFDLKVFKELFLWARFIIPSSILSLFLVHIDKAIIAKTLSVFELGLYYIAFNLSSAVVAFSISFSRQIMEPRMAKVYRECQDHYLLEYYHFRMRFSVFLCFGVGLLSGVSYIFFDLLYNEEYIQSSFYMSILLIAAMLALLSYPSEVTLVLHGLIKTTFISNIIRVLWFVTSAYIGYSIWGFVGLLFSIALVDFAPTLYMFYKLRNLKLLVFYKELYILFFGLFGFGVGFLITNFYRG